MMNRLTNILVGLAAIALLSTNAYADQHFILEVNGGVATDTGIEAEVDPGKAISGTFGFGGRIPGQSPAYYLIGRVGQSEFAYEGKGSLSPIDVQQTQSEWALGGRLYLPVTDDLRILGQVALGQTTDEATLDGEGISGMTLESDSFTIFGQIGLQYRVTDNFALGAAADLAIHPDHHDRDLAAREASIGSHGELGRAKVGLTGTFHF